MPQENGNHQKISVIIPVFNEPQIAKNLAVIEDELRKSFSDYEIICVDDGSSDETSQLLREYQSPYLKIIGYSRNVGKGFALCSGFYNSTGDLIAFIDADLELHPRQLRLFYDLMSLVNADVVIGSKRHPLSQVEYSAVRKIYSSWYQFLIRILFGLNVTDTQVGIKLFKRNVLEGVLPKIAVKAWAFDLEVLVVAYHLGYKRIIEAPVELKARLTGSKINVKSIKNILQDTAAIFYRQYLLRFYDRKTSYHDTRFNGHSRPKEKGTYRLQ